MAEEDYGNDSHQQRGSKKRNGSGSGGGSSGGSGGGGGFQSLGLSNAVYRGITHRLGYRLPTPVQRKALPIILTGVDTVVMARTGSGKTAAFLIPLLERLLLASSNNSNTSTISSMTMQQQGQSSVRGIIISPTRELSVQTLRVFNKLASETGAAAADDDNGEGLASSILRIRAIGIHGGEGMEKQFNLLASRPDVIVATPGRLAHHLQEIPDFTLGNCQMCILDEADRLLEMGFAQQIRQIARTLPTSSCQRVLLSATMPKVLVEFTKGGMFTQDPTVVRLDQEATVSAELRIAFVTCRSMEKDAALLYIMHLIQQEQNDDDDNDDHDHDHDDQERSTNRRNGDKKNTTNDKRNHKNKNSNSSGGGKTATGLTLIFAATRHHVDYIATLLSASGIDSTVIYGSLDQEARASNLAAFRTGKKPVLVVTDVAARGIDVPLIDHVIHYHFPPSPKLFVHRSGRAARAGRIGYCWGLVEPDELPYMMDLHLFLGRKPSTGAVQTVSSKSSRNNGRNNNDIDAVCDGRKEELMYTLKDMTPEMVHYGSLPESISMREVENVQRIMNCELSCSLDAQALKTLTRVCNNAMQQYRRTRTEASREAVRRAKDILEGERIETGQRIGGGAIPPHPLLRHAEQKEWEARGVLLAASRGDCDAKAANAARLDSAENLKRRNDFLVALSNFRPKESVFEAFATGKGNKDTGVVSHLDKGRTTSKKSNDSSIALNAMKNMRRQVRMARDKGSTLVVAGSEQALKLQQQEQDNIAARQKGVNEDVHSTQQAGKEKRNLDSTKVSIVEKIMLPPPTIVDEGKRRLSKAERKRQKKSPSSETTGTTDTLPTHDTAKTKKKIMRATDFRDPSFFIDNELANNSEEAQRSRHIEAAMQPSAASNNKGAMGSALRLEEAMLDIVGDDNEALVKQQRMVRWDKAKRKYVKTTVGDELNGDSKTKKMRLESGQLIKNDKAKLGELYQQWQKKTNRSVGRSGVFDDVDGALLVSGSRAGGKKNKKGSRAPGSGGSGGGAGGDNEKVKSAASIQKDREKKHQMTIKNMKKSDRRRYEQRTKATAGKGDKKSAR